MKKEATVLVVDDEPKILEVVTSYLENGGYEALAAQTGAQAFSIMEERRVSLILLDLMLPDMAGEDICRKVRESSAVPIIMMTAKSDEESIIGGLGIGADDYVAKPFSPRQLMARVAAALRRSGAGDGGGAHGADGGAHGTGQAGAALGRSGLHVDKANRKVSKNGKPVKLTPSEYKILLLLIATPQKTFSRDEIICAVKTDDYDGFDRTIDTHIKNLRQKIEDDPKSPRYVVTAHGFGYKYGGGS